jgi:hypothetical protein
VAFNGVGTPGWSDKAAADLEAGIRAGAIGLKIFKQLGLQQRKADGSRLKIDDPELDALWQVCARMNVPVLIHTADPAQFFTKYQDRVLFGKDTFEASEYPYYWRVFETHDEYFDYYRDYHAFWKLYGMALPDAVLKKLYYKNALKVEPGLPQTGWPQ